MDDLHSYRLVIAYDGTEFHGWMDNQGVRTVAGILKESVAVLSDKTVEVEGSSRTDAGVPARGNLVRIRLRDYNEPET